MGKIQRILIAVKEPHSRTQPAALKAAQLARACGAEIELLYTLATPATTEMAIVVDQGLRSVEWALKQHALRQLETLATQLRKSNVKVTVSVEWDSPAYQAIIRRALRIQADLIVVSRHKGRHTAARILRLTDWELVRLSPIPVLLVKSPAAYRKPAVLAAVDPTHAFGKPLKLDEQILNLGAAISKCLAGQLHAVHAYSTLAVKMIPPLGLAPQLLKDNSARAENTARRAFERALRATSITRAHRYLLSGTPIDAIAQAASRSRSAIVVMGAVSRSGLKNLFIGNTAENILDHLGCDILVAKPLGFRNRVQHITAISTMT
jgi:universal stress protein E